MASAIHAPRVNNNDDTVKLVGLEISPGDEVKQGQIVAQVETDKSVVDVEAPADGFVLGIQAELEAMVAVGSVLLWIGSTRDEAIPAAEPAATDSGVTSESRGPTAKARLLLEQHGLQSAAIPMSGERLTAADVERFLAGGATPVATAAAPKASDPVPESPGVLRDLQPTERGMLHTVQWHRDSAVAGYIELAYDAAAWSAHAAEFKAQGGILFDPLLPLMAWQLARLAAESPRLNATIVGERRYEYSAVNLGFTVQAGDTLYLTVQHDAGRQSAKDCVDALFGLQRRAAVHKLTSQETRGATLGFSSMARWNVSRHIPVLAPYTSVMVAHAAAGPDGRGVLGVSYDHRVLSGADAVALLRKLSVPMPIAREIA